MGGIEDVLWGMQDVCRGVQDVCVCVCVFGAVYMIHFLAFPMRHTIINRHILTGHLHGTTSNVEDQLPVSIRDQKDTLKYKINVDWSNSWVWFVLRCRLTIICSQKLHFLKRIIQTALSKLCCPNYIIQSLSYENLC